MYELIQQNVSRENLRNGRIIGFFLLLFLYFSTGKYNFFKRWVREEKEVPLLGQKDRDLFVYVCLFIWFLLLKLCVKGAP